MVNDYTATLVEKKELAPEIWSFRFQIPQGEGAPPLDFKAGQYLLLKIDDVYRQYSLATPASSHDEFRLIVEILPGGKASTFLKNLSVGGEAHFKGPAGVFTLQTSAMDKVFLATGTGIAPILSMIHTDLAQSGASHSLNLFFGLKTKEDVYLLDELSQLAADHDRFSFRMCLSREETLAGLDEKCFGQGRVDKNMDVFMGSMKEATQKPIADVLNNYEYYVCGSKMVVDSLKVYLAELGISPAQVFFERFG